MSHCFETVYNFGEGWGAVWEILSAFKRQSFTTQSGQASFKLVAVLLSQLPKCKDYKSKPSPGFTLYLSKLPQICRDAGITVQIAFYQNHPGGCWWSLVPSPRIF